jgi:type I restriction enzyme S subunit
MTGALLPSFDGLRPNPDWAKLPLFDRTGWQRVRFGDVVENLNETARNPAEVGIERFIGLEHLEPGSLHIRAWGNVADGTTFTRCCRPGQVIFGKRRAYQRKVAVAEFDAVVSGDIYVLAPKNDRLLPGLLPFLCMSERFFQHAVGTSAGSLSPRTNWSSLAGFEFDLAPLDQQRRIAEILWAVDEATQAAKTLTEQIKMTIETTARAEVFPFGYSPNNHSINPEYGSSYTHMPAEELYDIFSGNGEPHLDDTGNALFFKVNDFNLNPDETVIDTGATRFSTRDNPDTRVLPVGTVVFPKRGASIFLNKVGVIRRPVALDPNLMGLVPKTENVSSNYLYWLIKLTQIGRIADTTSLPQINHKHLIPLMYPVPARDRQDDFIEQIERLCQARKAAQGEVSALGCLAQQLTNTVVGRIEF